MRTGLIEKKLAGLACERYGIERVKNVGEEMEMDHIFQTKSPAFK
jgi:hypothetical protein